MDRQYFSTGIRSLGESSGFWRELPGVTYGLFLEESEEVKQVQEWDTR